MEDTGGGEKPDQRGQGRGLSNLEKELVVEKKPDQRGQGRGLSSLEKELVVEKKPEQGGQGRGLSNLEKELVVEKKPEQGGQGRGLSSLEKELAFSKGSLEKTTVSPETLLLGLSQGALAIGLLLLALSPGSNADLVGYLTGDFLMITLQDVSLIWGLLIVVLILLQWFWSPLLAVLIHPDLAVVEGLSATQLQAGFLCIAALACMLILSATGILFLSTLLVFPTLTLSPWARTPEQVCIWASLLAAFSVTVGLGLSIGLNIPTGPVITVLLLSFFAFSRLMLLFKK